MVWNTPGDSGSNQQERASKSSDERRQEGGSRFKLPNPFQSGGSNLIIRWFAVIACVSVVFSSFHIIREQQMGMVLRFGRFVRTMPPGPALSWPWPIESVTKVNVTEIKTFSYQFPVLTADENIVNVAFNVQYQVSNARQYLYNTRDADLILEQAAQSAVREQIGHSALYSVLNDRGPLAVAAKDRLQGALDTYRTGLTVTSLMLPDARPPDEVKSAFDEVNSAQQIHERLISEAQAYAAKTLPQARGQAASIRAKAQADKQATIANAEGEAQRFDSLLSRYKNGPQDLIRYRLWLDTMQEALSKNPKIVGLDEHQILYVPANLGAAQSMASAAPLPPFAGKEAPSINSEDATVTTVPQQAEDDAESGASSASHGDGAFSAEPMRNPVRLPRTDYRQEDRGQ